MHFIMLQAWLAWWDRQADLQNDKQHVQEVRLKQKSQKLLQ